jgi:hypothetical protein
MAKKEQKTKNNKKPRNFKPVIGLAELVVVASIAFSTTVVILGTDGFVTAGLVAPQALWAVVTLIKRFAR